MRDQTPKSNLFAPRRCLHLGVSMPTMRVVQVICVTTPFLKFRAPAFGIDARRPDQTTAQGKLGVKGLAVEGTDEDSNRVTATTMAPVWLGFDAARNLAFLKGW